MSSSIFRNHNKMAKKQASSRRRQESKRVESSSEANAIDLLPVGYMTTMKGRTFIASGVAAYTINEGRKERSKERGTFVKGKDKKSFRDL